MFGRVSVTIEAAIETGVVGAGLYFQYSDKRLVGFYLSERKSGSL